MAFTYLRDLESSLQNQMPLWASAHFIPRGLLIPLDPFMNGEARAAKRVGDVMPVLVPNNSTTLLNELHTEDKTFVLSPNTLSYLKEDMLLSLNGQRTVRITRKVGDEITISERAGIPLPAGSSVYIYAFPLVVLGDHTIPNPPLPRPDIIELKSNVKMMKGDFLAIPDTIPGNFKEYEIVEVIAFRKSIDPIDAPNPLIWEVRIEQVKPPKLPIEIRDFVTSLDGIPRDLSDGETIYLRAFPAYFSKPLIVDTAYFHIPNARIGPYILDRVSGLVIDNPQTMPPTEENPAGESQKDVDEFIDIELLTSGLNIFKTARLGVRDQLPVWNSTIESDHLVMWDVTRGTIDFELGFVVMNLDKYGLCEIESILVPEIDPTDPQQPTFRMFSRSDKAYQICLDLYPNIFKVDDVQAVSTSSTSSTLFEDFLELGADPLKEKPRAIKITVKGLPGQRIEIHSVVSILPTVTNVRYNILARTVGNYHWASSGILQKPMWLSAYLTEAFGEQVPMDSGRLMFPRKAPGFDVLPPPGSIVTKLLPKC